jgi:hypothetical protein
MCHDVVQRVNAVIQGGVVLVSATLYARNVLILDVNVVGSTVAGGYAAVQLQQVTDALVHRLYISGNG